MKTQKKFTLEENIFNGSTYLSGNEVTVFQV